MCRDFAGIMSVECAVVYTVCARLSCELAGACLVSLREGGGASLAVLQVSTHLLSSQLVAQLLLCR